MQRGLVSPQALCAKRLASVSAAARGVAPLRLARKAVSAVPLSLQVRAEQATSAAPTEQQQQEVHSNGNGAAANDSSKRMTENTNDLDFDSVTARELAENGTTQKILSTTHASTQSCPQMRGLKDPA